MCAPNALCWFQVLRADRLSLLAKQRGYKSSCDEVPLNCYFLSAWRDQQKIKSSYLFNVVVFVQNFTVFWRVYNHKLQNAPLFLMQLHISLTLRMVFEKLLKSDNEYEITVENYFCGRQHGSNK
jgi:hypothetical protein